MWTLQETKFTVYLKITYCLQDFELQVDTLLSEVNHQPFIHTKQTNGGINPVLLAIIAHAF